MTETIEKLIEPRARDLGGFEVRRVLPHVERRMVGPFIFFDHMGPVTFAPGRGVDVRPHPHICLATVTYLFEGELVHRDSLGCVQAIQPSDVNWMTAGRGIVHSERTGPEQRAAGARLHGIQSWVALPLAAEESAPSFHHYDAAALPVIERDGARVRLIAGSGWSATSPVATASEMLYADVTLDVGGRLVVAAEHGERAIYAVAGALSIDGGAEIPPCTMIVLTPGRDVTVAAPAGARLILLGGAPLEGARHIWWNFVASSNERIERAKRDWAEDRFAIIPGETQRMPLPDR